jgi:hypothetical protein
MLTTLLVAVLSASPPCPQAVLDAAQKAQPGTKVASCKEENERGKTQYEVKLENKIELDVSPDGKVLQTEEKVAVESVPKAVSSAFAARYPAAKASKAEKQTKADGSVTWELAFNDAKGKHEATFKADGAFLEEE